MNVSQSQSGSSFVRLSRREMLQSLSLAGAALAGASIWSGEARAAESAASAEVESPLLAQLEWFLTAVNSGGAELVESDIAEHLSPEMLAIIPPVQIAGLIQGIGAGFGTLSHQGMTRTPTATQAVALIDTAAGLQLALPIAIEASAPHRITGLSLYPSPTPDGAPLLSFEDLDDGRSGLVQIGDRRFYRQQAGGDGPTVVFEAGLGDSGATWAGILPAVAEFATVVSYDRANAPAGASDNAAMPRTAADAVADLRDLLAAGGSSGPYLLVGHSIGGIFARLFASSFPDEVAGLVLVDAAHEDQDERRRELVPADLYAVEQKMVQANPEGIDLGASFNQMRAAAPLPPVPLIVISAGLEEPERYPAGWPLEAERALHDELQEALAALVPGGKRIVAEQSSHYVQQGRPDVIVRAIREVADLVVGSR